MTVGDYLAFCARIKGVPRSERASRLQSVMEKTQIADVSKRHCGKLSKGYRQRVGLAQALLHNPDVLILDEPTAGLDPKQINETRRLIKGLGGDHTIILSTHILPEVSQTCNRIVIINRGKVVAVDTPDNLTARLRGSETMYVQVDAMGADADQTLSSIPGVTCVTMSDRRETISGYEVESESGRDVRRQLAATIVGAGWGLLELRPMRMSLEEIFLQVTTEDHAGAAIEAGAEAAPEAAAEASHESHPRDRTQGAQRLLRVADRLRGDWSLRADVWLLLLRAAALLRSTEHADGRAGRRRRRSQRQRTVDSAGLPEHDGHLPVHPAHGHHADVLGGKTLRYD